MGQCKGYGYSTVKGTHAKENTRGGSALELGDLRLFEDGGERGGALGPDAVVRDTASEGQDGSGERVRVSTGADRKANTRFERRAATPAISASNCRAAP